MIVINIEKGDIIEIIGEPFKKEKAKVVRIDKTKGEAVVTLLAAVVPIPVTVKLDNIKVIRREKEESQESESSDSESQPKEKSDEEPRINMDYENSGGLIPDEY